MKTIAVALNPTDWQTVDERPKNGTEYALLGCDVSVGEGLCLYYATSQFGE